MTEHNGTGGALDGLPKWVRAVAVVGLPGVGLLVLLWLLTSGLPANAADAKKASERAVQMLAEQQTESERQLHDLERLLIRICLNTSQDAQSAEACWANRP